MSDTWAGVLSISVAVMALVQVAVLVGLAIAATRLMAVVQRVQEQVEGLAADVRLRVTTVSERLNAVTDQVNAVAEDVRGVTARVQQVANSVSDGVHRVEQSVRTVGQRVSQSMDQVPPSVKKAVPAGLAILAALRTVQHVRARMREKKGDDAYVDPETYAAT